MTSHRAYTVLLLWFKTIHCYDRLVDEPVYNISYKLQCQEKTCIPKCCPEDYGIKGFKSCVHNPDKSLDFSDMYVYDADVTRVVSTVKEEMRLIPGIFNNETFKHEALDLSLLDSFNVYLTEVGVLYIESPNSFKRWIKADNNQFCVDYRLKRERSEIQSPKVWVLINEVVKESSPNTILSTYVLLVTCSFLLLVLIIYPLMPKNRTINGVIQFLSILSLFKVFVLLFVMSIRMITEEECLSLSGEKVLYMYVPSLILLLICVMFYTMTAKNMIRLKRGNTGIQYSAVNPAEFDFQLQRFMVNIALLTAMLLHCCLEITSSWDFSINLTYFVDIYGVVFGPLLFFILLVYPIILRRKALRRQENAGLLSTKSQEPIHSRDTTQSAQSTNANCSMTTIVLPEY